MELGPIQCKQAFVLIGNATYIIHIQEIRHRDHSVLERGKGNVCSIEVGILFVVLGLWLMLVIQFNFLYRWHATTSKEDDDWVKETLAELLDGKSPEHVTPADFKVAGHKVAASLPDITHWTFGR